MSDKFCCTTWETLHRELRDAKANEIADLIVDKKIPESVFAPVIKLLNRIHLHCPVCGEGLTEETKVKIPPRKAITPQAPTTAQQFIVCPQCKGQPQATVCMTCRGKGKLKPAKPVNVEKLNELEDLKQKHIKPYSKEAEKEQMKELED